MILASIEKVQNLIPVPNSQHLVRCDFGKYTFVGKEGSIHNDDIVVVVRAGSKIPYTLAKKVGVLRCLKNGEVKALTLRGTVSNCIVLNLEDVFTKNAYLLQRADKHIGEDITNILKITSKTWYNQIIAKLKKLFNA